MSEQTTTAPRLLDAQAAADLAGVSRRTWARLVDAGKAPRPVRLGRCVRWDRETLDRWIAGGCEPVGRVKGGA